MPIKTYKGMIPMGEQEKIHLSTADGLTGYRIKKFQIESKKPGTGNFELVGKIFLTDQANNVNAQIDFSDTDLIAAQFNSGSNGWGGNLPDSAIIIDSEMINQDIYVTVACAAGTTEPVNFYIELEQFNLDLNASTFVTLKNIRSITGPGFEFL